MPEPTEPGRPLSRVLHWCLLAMLLLRFATLFEPALVDTTEGRYGATGLHMLLSGDWVTPQIPLEHGYEPYLGKPPLHFWAMAVSFAVFGADEWAARLPSLVAAVLMVWATMSYARWRYDRTTAWLAGVVLSSGVLFVLFGGSVNVDMTLAAFVTVAITSFCRVGAGGPGSRIAGYLFFASLGFAVLTKGPFAIAITGLVGILHLVVHRNWRIATGLPWVGGSLLFLALVVPWYWLAEVRNPGFLRYFLVNENFGRLTSTDYGDRYGTGRKHALGSIWPQLLGCTLPWSLPLLLGLCTNRWRSAAWAERRREGAFLLLWTLAPALVFTFSPQFTVGYLLPGFGGFAILAARVLLALEADRATIGTAVLRVTSWLFVLAAPILVVVAWVGFGAGPVRGGIGAALGAAGLLWASPRLSRARELPAVAAGLGLAVAWTMALGAFVVTPYAGASKSVAPILARFLADDPQRTARIGIVFGTPYSAWFYGSAWTNDRVQFEHVEQRDLLANPLRDLFVKTGDLDGIDAAVRHRYRVAATVGEWNWLQRSD